MTIPALWLASDPLSKSILHLALPSKVTGTQCRRVSGFRDHAHTFLVPNDLVCKLSLLWHDHHIRRA